MAHRAVGRESTGKQRQTERNGHHDPETLPPPNQKKERREHSHRLVPTWCVAEEVLGEGWRCGCNPRSCRAVVEKSGQRPPVGAPPDENTVTGLRHVVCCPWTARGDLSSPHGPMSAPTHELIPWGPTTYKYMNTYNAYVSTCIFICIFIYVYIYIHIWSPLALHLAGEPGVYQAWSGPCGPCRPRAAHHMAQACDCVLVGRCSYGWPLP